jgi:uncharacterized protein YdeI (YjbR/CyaY-like superfamily)
MRRSKTVDEYINTSERWQPELKKLRATLKATELAEEVKWGAPCYTYNGKNVVGVGAFKSYLGLWFHQGALLADDKQVLINAQEGKTKALRQWRMQSSKDIKPAIIKRYIKEAIQLVKEGQSVGPVKRKRSAASPELKAALLKSKIAAKKFSELTPGRQREYAEYIADAKRDETKRTRLAKIMPMIKAGVGLNDRYRR